METILTLTISVEKPPRGVLFALQKGSGNDYESIQKQQSQGEDLNFEAAFKVKGDPNTDTQPVLLGPFAQGPPQERFLYLDIGASAGQVDTHWRRRLKVPLKGITWEQIKLGQLSCTIPGIGRDGAPNCGTVRNFEGWK
jgi:Family of unknown function (DUF5990)